MLAPLIIGILSPAVKMKVKAKVVVLVIRAKIRTDLVFVYYAIG